MAQTSPKRIPYEDPVRVDARHYRVDFEDDKVRVLQCKYGTGERSVMHGHPESIAIFLNDARFRFTYPDGKTEERRASRGEVMQSPAGEHLPENLTDNPLEVIIIELKS